MKGKLIKVEDGYNLFIEQPQGRLLEATCSISEIKRLEKNNVSFKKLSLKNCQTIENSYDLDEFDVEVEMICPHPEDTYRCGIEYGCDADGCNHPNKVPYTDKDGCLILKRL